MQAHLTLGTLVTDLKQQAKHFLRDELLLAKAELSEKASKLGKQATNIAIGGFVAYAGAIVILGALGMILAYAFEQAGLHPALARFVGLAIIGLIVAGAGAVMLMGGIKAIKRQSLTPERTVETLQNLKGTPPVMSAEEVREARGEPTAKTRAAEAKPKPSPQELEVALMRTESEMADTLQELTEKVTLKEFRQKADVEIREHPYKWGLLAAGVGLASGYLIERSLLRKMQV